FNKRFGRGHFPRAVCNRAIAADCCRLRFVVVAHKSVLMETYRIIAQAGQSSLRARISKVHDGCLVPCCTRTRRGILLEPKRLRTMGSKAFSIPRGLAKPLSGIVMAPLLAWGLKKFVVQVVPVIQPALTDTPEWGECPRANGIEDIRVFQFRVVDR